MLPHLLRGAASDYIRTENARIVRVGDSIQLSLTFQFIDRHVDRKDIWLLQPRLVNGADSVDLPSVGVYGRMPYYYLVRSGNYLFQGDDDVMLRGKYARAGVPFFYTRTVRHRAWAEGAEVHMEFIHLTCCGDVLQREGWRIIDRHKVVLPDSIVQRRFTAVAAGVAHVDFVLDSIWIDPEYHDNRRELGKISHLIDSLQANPEIHIDTVTLHGYASPEGPYKHNVWLAKNRVKALAGYIANRHSLDPAIISQQSTPEDWAGLRKYVDESSLPHREEILKVIDDTLRRPDPDLRLRYIRRTYVEDFADIFDPTRPEVIPTQRPLFAVKTNLLFDLALFPNLELEVPLGRDARWSILAEWGSAWYVWRHNSRAYEVVNAGVEARRWFGRCPGCRPVLTGFFLGAYASAGKFDLEWNSKGNQGEFVSFGPSVGYSWVLSRNLNIEASGTLGIVLGQRRRYDGEFQDTHLIWKRFGDVLYGGPTQLKVSLVWLIPRKWFGLKD